MTAGTTPEALRRLGLTLRGLRLDAQLSGRQLAEQAGLSQSTVSRIELGQAVPTSADVDAWARATSAPPRQLGELRELLQAAAVEMVSWRGAARRRGLPELQQDVRELEAAAGTILNFQPTLIPGLLQTADYARRLILSGYPGGRPDIAAAVGARMERQAIIYEEGRHLAFVIAEAALRWRLGPPPVMLAQLGQVASLATLPSVTVAIIPQAAEDTAWHVHGFVLLDDLPGGQAMVRVETLTSGLVITEPGDVERYRQAFSLLRESALCGDDADAIIRSAMNDLQHSSG